jgi:hypothetical protein
MPAATLTDPVPTLRERRARCAKYLDGARAGGMSYERSAALTAQTIEDIDGMIDAYGKPEGQARLSEIKKQVPTPSGRKFFANAERRIAALEARLKELDR